MSEELFNLVFSGDLVKGSQEDAVKANLIRLFKLAPEQVDKMFSGKVITIKKNVDEDTGRKLRAKFKQAGAVCRLESFSATSVSSQPAPQADQTEAESQVASSKVEKPSSTDSSVSSPAVFKIPDDPIVEAQAETESAENSSSPASPVSSPENSPASSQTSSPAVFSIPDDPVEEKASAEPDAASTDSNDSMESESSNEVETIASNDEIVSDTPSEPAVANEQAKAIAEHELAGNNNAETSESGLTIAPPGADVLEGYTPPEPPPPPNVDSMSIAPAGTDLLDVKKVIEPVVVDISGISLVKDDA